MLTPMTIVSFDQGNLKPAPRSIGDFDSRLLIDIGYDEPGFGGGKSEPKPGLLVGMIRFLNRFAVTAFSARSRSL